jgi:hypothetical protein
LRKESCVSLDYSKTAIFLLNLLKKQKVVTKFEVSKSNIKVFLHPQAVTDKGFNWLVWLSFVIDLKKLKKKYLWSVIRGALKSRYLGLRKNYNGFNSELADSIGQIRAFRAISDTAPSFIHLRNTSTNSSVYLIGTTHSEPRSLDRVNEVLSVVQPDYTLVELCEGRLETISSIPDSEFYVACTHPNKGTLLPIDSVGSTNSQVSYFLSLPLEELTSGMIYFPSIAPKSFHSRFNLLLADFESPSLNAYRIEYRNQVMANLILDRLNEKDASSVVIIGSGHV